MHLRLRGQKNLGITAQASVVGNVRTDASGRAGIVQKIDRIDPMVDEGAQKRWI